MSSEKDTKLSPVDSGNAEEKVYPALLLNAEQDIYDDGTVDPIYQAKARLLNAALKEIGMGRYQVRLHHCKEGINHCNSYCIVVVSVHRCRVRMVCVSCL